MTIQAWQDLQTETCEVWKSKEQFSGEVRKISGGLTDKRNASENKQVLPLLFAESCSVV